MLRRAFGICAALSLLLLIATVVLWIRSYWVADSLEWDDVDSYIAVTSSRGRCGAGHFEIGPVRGSWTFRKHTYQSPVNLPTKLPSSGVLGSPRLGIFVYRGTRTVP